MKSFLEKIAIFVVAFHIIGWGITSIYYEWEYQNKHSAVNSYFFSNLAGNLKGFFWEYHLLKNITKENSKNISTVSPTDNEIVRMREIAIAVMRNPYIDIEPLKSEFWSILNRVYNGNSEQATKDMIGLIDMEQMEYGKYFWIDAMTSYKQGRLYLSNKLLSLEEEMLKKGIMPQARIDYNHDMLSKIALREPLIMDSQNVVFDEFAIQASIDNSSIAIQRFLYLIDY